MSKPWFRHTPGGGNSLPAYTPCTWQGWLIFVGYFVSFVFTPVVFSSIMPWHSTEAFLLMLAASMVLTTGIYVLIAKKKS